MRTLPSSGEHRFEAAKAKLVIDLYWQQGIFWERVAAARREWNVEVVRKLPPTVPAEGRYYPVYAGVLTEVPHREKGRRWIATLHTIHDAAVPQEARFLDDSHGSWELFISGCLLFDPPHDRLEDFAGFFSWRATSVGSGRYAMHDPPITWLRDAGQAEEALMDFYEGLIHALWERHVPAPEIGLEEAVNEILADGDLRNGLAEARARNRPRPYLDPKPHHTVKDAIQAYDLLSSQYPAGSRLGRPPGNALRAVQCVVLHERLGWKYEEIAKLYGYRSKSNVDKLMKQGRSARKT